MRLILILACALALGGCNFVYSERPLFTAADARGAPQLRPGVWMKPEKDCVFDRSRPVTAWPACAGGMLVRPGVLQEPGEAKKTLPYLLMAGDPPLFQAPIDNEKKTPVYGYGGLDIAKRDARGRVTEFSFWVAQCGPPPPKPKPDDPHPRYVTEHPLPGLTVDEKSGMCRADAQGPIRAAVKASQAWDDDKRPAVWVRDGEE